MRVRPEPSPPGSRWLRLYPRDWRDRYGDELRDVLDTRAVDWRIRLDLARGALDAHLHPTLPPSVGVLGPVVAGLAWIAAGSAALIEPVPPDWPGYLLWTLPLGLVGAIAQMRLVMAIGRRSGLFAPASAGPTLVVAVLGHVLWIVSLAVATIGGPYGAVTAAAQSIAAVGTIGVGLVRWRVADHPTAEAVLIAGGAMLVPTPAAWVVAGAAWLATAVVARPRIDVRPA